MPAQYRTNCKDEFLHFEPCRSCEAGSVSDAGDVDKMISISQSLFVTTQLCIFSKFRGDLTGFL